MEAGCDEAGRGCLAGPVVAAAVMLPKGYRHRELDDSKKLTEKSRNRLRLIIEKDAICWSVAFVPEKKIDEMNILNASFLAMHKAIDQLAIKPQLLLIDGNRFNPYSRINHECIVRGDGIYASNQASEWNR